MATTARFRGVTACAVIALILAVVAALTIGPARLPVGEVIRELIDRIPLVHLNSKMTVNQANTVWDIRFPRIVLGALVGSMLSGSGAAYQGAFRNPLADPYLLGVAAGAGLGATVAIVAGASTRGGALSGVPLAAFAGAMLSVALTYVAGGVGRSRSSTALLLAGVAVASFLTAAQTFVLQQNTDVLREVYSWILGRLTVVGWNDVAVIAPYVAISSIVLLAMAPTLDVLAVGDEEAATLGVRPRQARAIVIIAASLGTAAAVAVSGLIGFVGIIVPHTIRLLVGGSHRRILPLSMIGGAAFLVFTDLLARTVMSPAELPIGVITAFVGGPFFLLVMRRRQVIA
jgi:iron complex transport system permease protein